MLTICVGTGKLGSDTRHEEVVIDGIECPACMAIEGKLDAEGKLAEANLMLEHSDGMMAEQDEKIAKLEAQMERARELTAEIAADIQASIDRDALTLSGPVPLPNTTPIDIGPRP